MPRRQNYKTTAGTSRTLPATVEISTDAGYGLLVNRGWLQTFRSSRSEVQRDWDALVNAGCVEGELEQYFWLASVPKGAEAEPRLKRQALVRAKQFTEAANILATLFPPAAQGDLVHAQMVHGAIRRQLQINHRYALRADLREFAFIMQHLPGVLRMLGKRISDRSNWYYRRRSKAGYLPILDYVVKTTGSPHYERIANLLFVAIEAHGASPYKPRSDQALVTSEDLKKLWKQARRKRQKEYRMNH